MAGAFKKLGGVAVGGVFTALSAINGYQLGKKQGLYEHAGFLTMANHDAAELVGVTLGIGQSRYVFETSKDGFVKDSLRRELHDTVTKQFEAGLIGEWQKSCVTHVNSELYHQGIPLTPKESLAITDAHVDMHRCRDDFTENPRHWCAEKYRTEARIANTFREGGSTIGYIAHMGKGLMEATLCIAAQPLAIHKKAMQEKIQSVKTGHVSSTMSFKGRLSEIKTKPLQEPVSSAENSDEKHIDSQMKLG